MPPREQICYRDDIEITVKGIPFVFKALTTYEQNLYISHCLELNLVATDTTSGMAKEALGAVVRAHVLYAIENKNMEYLYHSAPQDTWNKYFNAE